MARVATLGCALALCVGALGAAQFANPVARANFPDPGALRLPDGSGFVVVATSDANEQAPRFPILFSRDLVNWEPRGFVFPQDAWPAWASADFWAPELHVIPTQAGDTRYVVFFTARHSETRLLAVGAASAASPFGPFVDVGQPLVHNVTAQLGSIDATYWCERSASSNAACDAHYLVWKIDGNGAVPMVPSVIQLQQLDPDTLALVPDAPIVELVRNDQQWEEAVVEAPWLVKRGGYYYLFYSAACYAMPSYAVGVARARALTGPYEKQGDPVLHTDWALFNQGLNSTFEGPGHCSVLELPEPQGGSSTWMLYHAWLYDNVLKPPGRVMLLDEVRWGSDGWPVVGNGGAPSVAAQQAPLAASWRASGLRGAIGEEAVAVSA